MGVVSAILILFVSLLLPGVVARTRSLMGGRRGPSMLQHLSGLDVMLGKGVVYSPTATWIFRAAPMNRHCL